MRGTEPERLFGIEPAYLAKKERKMERNFTETRKNQGFKSQAHLDAFFTVYDHTSKCEVCTKIAGYIDIGDGMQPYAARCEIGTALEKEWFKF